MVCYGLDLIVNQEVKIFTRSTIEIEVSSQGGGLLSQLFVLFGYRMSFSERG